MKSLKIILTIFAPVLLAILWRIILAILCLVVGYVYWINIIDKETFRDAENLLIDFNMFSWDESWLYWVLVIISTFLAEMIIWSTDGD